MTKLYSVGLLGLNLVMVLPAAILAFLSVFMFDSPGASGNVLLWAMAIGIWVAPQAFVAGAVFAVSALRSSRKTELLISAACLIVPIVYVGSSYFLLDLICGGETVCD